MKTLEHDEQVAFFNWAAMKETQVPALKLMFAIPNGGHRHKAVAAKMKAEGVKAGVPDIFLAYPAGGFHGLFIEMKVGKNKTTKNQDQWIKKLQSAGYKAIVCYGWTVAVEEINLYLTRQI